MIAFKYKLTYVLTILGKLKSKLLLTHVWLAGSNPDQIDYYLSLTEWLLNVFSIGLIINYVVWSLIGLSFTLYTIFGYGMLWWLISKFRGKGFDSQH